MMIENSIASAFESDGSTRSAANAATNVWDGTLAKTSLTNIGNALNKTSQIRETGKTFKVAQGAAVTNTTAIAKLLQALDRTASQLVSDNLSTVGMSCSTGNASLRTVNEATFTFNTTPVAGYVIEYPEVTCISPTSTTTVKETELKFYTSKETDTNKFIIADIEHELSNEYTGARAKSLVPTDFQNQITFGSTLEGETEYNSAGIRKWGNTAASMAFINDFTASSKADLLSQDADYAILMESEEIQVEAEHASNELAFEIEYVKITDETGEVSSLKEIEFENESSTNESLEYWTELTVAGHDIKYNFAQNDITRTSNGSLAVYNTSASTNFKFDVELRFRPGNKNFVATINNYFENGTKHPTFTQVDYQLMTDDVDETMFLILGQIR